MIDETSATGHKMSPADAQGQGPGDLPAGVNCHVGRRSTSTMAQMTGTSDAPINAMAVIQ